MDNNNNNKNKMDNNKQTYPSKTPFEVPCKPQAGEILVLMPQKLDKKGGIILTDEAQSQNYAKLTLTVVAVGAGLEDLNLKQGDEVLTRRLFSDKGTFIPDLNGVFRWQRWDTTQQPKVLDFMYEYGIMSRHQMLVKFEDDAVLSEFI